MQEFSSHTLWQFASRIFPSELTIGFEQNTYTTSEGNGTVTVCAEILEGSVQRSVGVSFNFRAQDGTAGE